MLDFSLLVPEFAEKARELIVLMKAKGYNIAPYCGLRTLSEQARLYRRSRTTAQINEAIHDLRTKDCDYLADIMEEVGPQKTGAWATNALPGLSYHAFGLAMDVLLKPGFDSDYKVYGDTAINLGLTSGYYFTKARDGGHVQLGKENIPHGYTLKQCNDYFKERGMK